ncbi:MAG: hypothetical protein PHP06_00410 [Clostridia bacterium]|nr:hypothetical protein [Clostridia bacterium]
MGKSFIVVDDLLRLDCNKIPTYRIESSKDHAKCRRFCLVMFDHMQPQLNALVAYGCAGTLHGRTAHYHGW